MSINISEEKLEALVERAYLNGIAAAGIARASGGSLTDAADYKTSTSYHDMKSLPKAATVIMGWDAMGADGAHEACEQLQKKLPKFGLFVYKDPTCEGTDGYGFVVSQKSLTEEEVMMMTEEARRLM